MTAETNTDTHGQQLIVVSYNPEWPYFFKEESRQIQFSLGNECIDIHHVGSTSVPYLSAKPIIDIILVVNSLEKVNFLLKTLGYHYQGEYNLPLHDFYKKENPHKINLHVHRVGNPEVKLNLMFRDFLRKNKEAREAYERIKIQASHCPDAGEKVETGVTKYNLFKNDIILSLLKQAGFEDLCVRIATQYVEHEAFHQFKKNFLEKIPLANDSMFSSITLKKFVLYQGTEIIGAAELSHVDQDRVFLHFLIAHTTQGSLELLKIMIEWLRIRTSARKLEILACLKEQEEIYKSLGFYSLLTLKKDSNPIFIKEL